MSRHRLIRNQKYDDDEDDDYNYDDYGSSPISPSAEKYLFKRPAPGSSNGSSKTPLALTPTAMSSKTAAAPASTGGHDAKMDAALAQIVDVLGNDFGGHDQDHVVAVLLSFNYDISASLEELTKRPQLQRSKGSSDGDKWKGSNNNLPFELDLEDDHFSRSKKASAGSNSSHNEAAKPSSTPNSSKSMISPEVCGGGDDENETTSPRTTAAPDSARKSAPAGPQRTPAKQRELDAMIANETASAAPTTSVEKRHVNLVVIGHVDAGKSTINGHLLVLTGRTDAKAMHKERARGVTINVGMNYFETPHRRVTLLDAPGHRDFVPNMISGAAQADFAILVIDATPGAFETGFGPDGQTKEHAVLARSLGVTQLIVAVNKMDVVAWSQARFEDIRTQLSLFLKQSGFRDKQVTFVPCSGLTGANLVARPTPESVAASAAAASGAKVAADTQVVDISWMTGPSLLEAIDTVEVTDRAEIERAKPFRFCVADVYRSMQLGFAVGGRIEAGAVMIGDRLLLTPIGESATVKAIHVHEQPRPYAVAGENVDLGLTMLSGSGEVVTAGDVLCDPANPIALARRVLTFVSGAQPMTRGYDCVFHAQSIEVACVVSRLLSLIDPSTGEVKKNKPRLLGEGQTALVEVKFTRALPLERYADFKQLGRFMLRKAGRTVAAGIILDVLE